MDRVRVKVFATLRRYVPELGIGEAMEVEVSPDTSLEGLLSHLGVPHQEVRVVYVNNICRDLNYRLVDGDQVGIFPAVGGG
ncbi:MAG: MoaD/ThiS family protein [Chloroflexota bacterium]|nr:MoaD/ThiS family protein [Anaerolineae bacterium]